MKKDDIQYLLKKYQEGTITESELSMLNHLTRKDEVMNSAFSQADSIIRRRIVRFAALAMTGLVVIGAGIWVMTPKSSSPSMVAMAQEIPSASTEVISQETNTSAMTEVVDKDKSSEVAAAEIVGQTHSFDEKKTAKPARGKKPVVVCNTQCDADAVINDIWKFLSV
ncbi:MAG: hypothetical protein J5677_03410 [Bacteroidales bacterium]|nr:hypothetical protein [Bacteroidales bacterium]